MKTGTIVAALLLAASPPALAADLPKNCDWSGAKPGCRDSCTEAPCGDSMLDAADEAGLG